MAEPTLAIRVGARVRALRKAAGLTQAQVADACGLAFETVSRIERGQNMTLEVAGSIASALGVSLSTIFEGTDVTPRSPSRAESRIFALLHGLDEEAKNDVYRVLRHMVSVRNPTRPARRKRARS